MSLPLAAFSASVARTRACWAEPLASEMPVWAWVFTSSMRTSLRLVRSWVFSTSADKVSTFWFTSPTSRLTYFLVAQPETATPRIRTGMSTVLIGPPMLGVMSRQRHIAASGADHHALAGGPDFDAAETGRA